MQLMSLLELTVNRYATQLRLTYVQNYWSRVCYFSVLSCLSTLV